MNAGVMNDMRVTNEWIYDVNEDKQAPVLQLQCWPHRCWGPRRLLASWLLLMSCLSFFFFLLFSFAFPGGFATQSRMLSPRWWLLQVSCVFEHAYSHYLSLYTHCLPDSTGQKGASYKPFKVDRVASLISALHLRDLALGKLCNWQCSLVFQLLYLQLGSLHLIWVSVFPLFFSIICTESLTPAHSTHPFSSGFDHKWSKINNCEVIMTPPNTKGDQSECMRCQSYGKNGWLSSV